MKFKLLMRRLFGFSASRMTIRRHVPWPMRLATTALAVAVGAVGAIWLWQYLFGHVSATQESQRVEIARLRTELERVDVERQKFEGFVNSASSQIKVEKTAADRLAGQIKALEEENALLKSDIAYFESLLPAGSTADSGVSIRRFEVSTDSTTNQIRYRALLMQGGRLEKEFSGNVQFVFNTVNAGRAGIWTWPDMAAGDARDRGKLSFKRYQRLEGSIELPAGTSARSVQLRVLERGALRVQQSINM